MPDTDENITNLVTVGDFEAEYEGSDFDPRLPSRDQFICDWCTTAVPCTTSERLGQYVANNVINDGHPLWQAAITRPGPRPFVPMATLCPDCTTRKLLLPCRGYAEVRFTFDLGGNNTFRNVKVTDFSSVEDGIPWDPEEMAEQIMGIPFNETIILAGGTGIELWAPEDVVRLFESSRVDVDIRQLIRADGSLDPEAADRAQEEYDKFLEEMQRENSPREWFRDRNRK